MTLSPLPRLMLEGPVRAALSEDLGLAGDLTSAAVIPAGHCATVTAVARRDGVVAGLDLAALAFELIDPSCRMTRHLADGDQVAAGGRILTVEGLSASLLKAERTALNFLCHLSGVATVTNGIVRAVAGTRASIACTRKTTPGLRALEKYAVRAGGGVNHRFALSDAVLIKDNHIAMTGGIRAAVESARANTGHMVKIELEVDTLAQLREAMEVGVDAVLLDNMTPDQLREAVGIVAGRALTEASGGVTPDTASAIAATGVDLISVGWITHSAPILDIGLDYVAGGFRK
ncbi:nicotinate-nucleotide pyrophosphorylase [carboxylating] [Paracoccus alcaliphilus]|uniref:Probable nicotinate-nucleotide pyrophosphorylase [carboxylating] n=1 Tax=Paracoccus alcaliphilus TaxID=34002 RepID=A0A1H8LAC2_9RHOB|nr:carboxylating nicotinate-nucleotide diphosphorylase [Paracoccus alcaliphilus]WCR20152.1 carboxylating nicotinate-nucleotide diphosphorylase [Paracoccus alcaliphilus]SEO02019.1 nicotinate-nucleotide pyrophosphorylase [carboxylating] [Paracoccus alcaliphilus]